MASIKDLLQKDLVIADLQSTDKQGVIREFSRLLLSTGKVAEGDGLVRLLLEREMLGSTGIGEGIAIPHAKASFLREMLVAFGRSRAGVDFQAMDGKPVHLFFLLVTPDDNPGEHLRTLARISRILKNRELRDRLKQASQRDELFRLIADEDGKYPQR